MPRYASIPTPTAKNDLGRNLFAAGYLLQTKVARQDPGPVLTITSTSVVTHNPPPTITTTTSISAAPTNASGPTLITLSTPLTSVFTSTSVSSYNGVGYTSLTEVTQTFPAGSVITSSSIPSSKSHIPLGAIVGAAVGGAALLGFLLFIVICFIRRRKRDPFKHFDLQHPNTGGGTLPKVELTPEGDVGRPLPPTSGPATVTPYTNVARPPSQPDMRYPYGSGQTGAAAAAYGARETYKSPISPSHTSPPRSPPGSYYPNDGHFAGQQAQGPQFHASGSAYPPGGGQPYGPSPGPSVGPTPGSTATSASLGGGIAGARNYKEQEAMARYQAQMSGSGMAHGGYDPGRGSSGGEPQGNYGESSHQASMPMRHHRGSASAISQQSYASMPGQGPVGQGYGVQSAGPVSPRGGAPSEERRPEVVVHRDMEAEALAAQQAREAQAMEAHEIPPTYESLVAASERR